MRLFLFKLCLHGLPYLLVVMATIFWCPYLAAPQITNNFSLNEKLIKYPIPNRSLDVISIGSSIALYNVHPLPLLERFKTSDYFNFSALGLQTCHLEILLPILIETYQPKKVIVTGGSIDFLIADTGIGTPEKKGEMRAYINSEYRNSFHLKYLNIPYIIRETWANVERMNVRNQKSLRFGPYGTLLVRDDEVIRDRDVWHSKATWVVENRTYALFENMCRDLSQRGVQLFYVHAPIKQSALNQSFTEADISHKQRIEQICERHGHTFFDASGYEIPDVFYQDIMHLTESGAYHFTQYVMSQLNIEKLEE